jgi:hypothetical protein
MVPLAHCRWRFLRAQPPCFGSSTSGTCGSIGTASCLTTRHPLSLPAVEKCCGDAALRRARLPLDHRIDVDSWLHCLLPNRMYFFSQCCSPQPRPFASGLGFSSVNCCRGFHPVLFSKK